MVNTTLVNNAKIERWKKRRGNDESQIQLEGRFFSKTCYAYIWLINSSYTAKYTPRHYILYSIASG